MLSKAAYRHLSRMTSLAELASFLKANAPKTRKSVKLRKQRMLSRKEIQDREMADLRRAVFERAQGKCEVGFGKFGRCAGTATDLDHWLGGSGRRRQQQSVETCWALCRGCHEMRTAHVGGTRLWNEYFETHCAKYGYPFVAHVEHAPLPEKQIEERDDHDSEPPDQQERE